MALINGLPSSYPQRTGPGRVSCLGTHMGTTHLHGRFREGLGWSLSLHETECSQLISLKASDNFSITLVPRAVNNYNISSRLPLSVSRRRREGQTKFTRP
jgi:hypothetical protein